MHATGRAMTMEAAQAAAAQLTASVVSHGQMRLLNALIADLRRHAGPQLKRLIVTLNVPEREPLRAEDLPFEVLVLRNATAQGFGANHNQAFRHCETSSFAVLNPDLRLSSDALGALCERQSPGDGVLSPLILNDDGSRADAARRLPTPLRVATRKLAWRRAEPDPDFDWLAGMCLVLNSAAFRSVGGFDERFFMYCEDTDLCLRMQLAGWRVRYVSDVQVVHAARRHSHRTVRYMVWHVASLMRLWTSGVFWSYLLRRRKLVPLRQSALNRQQLQGPSDS